MKWLKSKQFKKALIVFLILAVAAMFLVWLLQYRYFHNSAGDSFNFMFTKKRVFLYSSLIMFFILMFFYGITRRPFTSVAIVTSVVLIFGYITITKYGFRGVPLLPEDFQLSSQAGTLMQFVNIWDIVRLIIAVILTLVLGGIFDWLLKKSPIFATEHPTLKKSKNAKQAKSVPPKTLRSIAIDLLTCFVIMVVAASGFLLATDFIRNHPNKPEIKVDFLGTSFVNWSQLYNYNTTGFLLGFLYNFGNLDIAAPDGYSEEAIDIIHSDLNKVSQETDSAENRTSLKDGDYNIIVVLGESFFDPEVIKEYYNYGGGDVTPNLHRLQGEVLSGTMFSPEYGGGTANVEYEVITGLSNYWLKTMPYTSLLPKQDKVPSLASFAVDNGMEASTIHPFSGAVYGRNNVLPKLGFGEFKTVDEFTYTDKDGKSAYINDRSSFAQALDKLHSSDKRQMISLITMQNHAPYTFEEYGEPKFKLSNDNLSEDEKNTVETYLMTVNKSDEYLGEFVEKVKNFDEPTVVLFYGDHSPGIFKQVINNSDQDISNLIRQTPYLIFSNFEFDKTAVGRVIEQANSQPNGNTEEQTAKEQENSTNTLPMTTPNCLSNTLLNLLNVEKPLTHYLLDTVCKETPTLAGVYYGVKAPETSTALSWYELLSYDLAGGKQYFLK